MKKAILTFGLFSLVLVLTSFTTPENDVQKISYSINVETGGTISGATVPPKKVDFETGGTISGATVPPKKVDFETGGTISGATVPPKKLD